MGETRFNGLALLNIHDGDDVGMVDPSAVLIGLILEIRPHPLGASNLAPSALNLFRLSRNKILAMDLIVYER